MSLMKDVSHSAGKGGHRFLRWEVIRRKGRESQAKEEIPAKRGCCRSSKRTIRFSTFSQLLASHSPRTVAEFLNWPYTSGEDNNLTSE